MKKTRTTATVAAPTTITYDAMRDAFTRYVDAQCQIKKIEAHYLARIEQIKAEAEAKAKEFKETIKETQAICQQWAQENHTTFEAPKPRKIEVYGGHMIGFQTCPHSVEFIRPTGGSKKQTADGFVAACHAEGDFATPFIRTKEEPNKDAIIDARAKVAAESKEDAGDPNTLLIFDARLATLGARVIQSRNFVIDLNLQPDGAASTTRTE